MPPKDKQFRLPRGPRVKPGVAMGDRRTRRARDRSANRRRAINDSKES